MLDLKVFTTVYTVDKNTTDARTITIVHVLKNELNLENVDDVINMLADNYIENSNEKTEILEEIQAENEYKLKKFEKRKMNKE